MDENVNVVLLEINCVGNTYGIVKLGIDLETDGGKVTSVSERMHLGPADTCLLTMFHPDQHRDKGSEAEKDNAGEVALQMAGIWHFPREHIKAKGLEVGSKRHSIDNASCSQAAGSPQHGLQKQPSLFNQHSPPPFFPPSGCRPQDCPQGHPGLGSGAQQRSRHRRPAQGRGRHQKVSIDLDLCMG